MSDLPAVLHCPTTQNPKILSKRVPTQFCLTAFPGFRYIPRLGFSLRSLTHVRIEIQPGPGFKLEYSIHGVEFFEQVIELCPNGDQAR